VRSEEGSIGAKGVFEGGFPAFFASNHGWLQGGGVGGGNCEGKKEKDYKNGLEKRKGGSGRTIRITWNLEKSWGVLRRGNTRNFLRFSDRDPRLSHTIGAEKTGVRETG